MIELFQNLNHFEILYEALLKSPFSDQVYSLQKRICQVCNFDELRPELSLFIIVLDLICSGI